MSSGPPDAPENKMPPTTKAHENSSTETTVTTPKRTIPSALPTTPPNRGSPPRLQTTPTHGFGSPGSPYGSPRPQFTSKSKVPGRWLPSYPEDLSSRSTRPRFSQLVHQQTSASASGSTFVQISEPGNQPGAQKKPKLIAILDSIRSDNLPSAMQQAAFQDGLDMARTTPPGGLVSSSSSSTSSGEKTPPFTIFDESQAPAPKLQDPAPTLECAAPIPQVPAPTPQVSAPQTPRARQFESNIKAPTPTRPKLPAVLQELQGYGPNNPLQSSELLWGMRTEKSKSPETLRRLLSEAQDRERVDDELVKMNVIPQTVPVIGVSGKTPRKYAFPTFPVKEGPKTKPFAPDDMVLQSMADIPAFLEKYKPKEVQALFGNYISSCEDINDMACPMRIGQLSIFVPINMKSGDVLIVGLAPVELFHARWQGTGSPAPPPDRSIIGKRAYAVSVKQPLRTDYTISRVIATPTGNTQGTVIGIVGGACVLRIEKWFLRSDYFKTESRFIPVMGDLPKNPQLVLFNSSQAYDEQKQALERRSKDRRDASSRLNISDLGGTCHQVPKDRVLGPNTRIFGVDPISRPKHLSVLLLEGVPEPRKEPERVPWDDFDDETANFGPDEKATATLIPSSSDTEGTMMEAPGEMVVMAESTIGKVEVGSTGMLLAKGV